MENKVIQDRLSALRSVMAQNGIDYYLIPTGDYHQSEYVSDYFMVRYYFSNFSGSNGTLLVWKDGAGLWTDGRYFIQAQLEIEGTGVTLFRMQDEGVPTIEEFMEENIGQGQTLGMDGRVVGVYDGEKYEEIMGRKGGRIVYDRDLAETIWLDRPAFPCGAVTYLSEEAVGESVEEKLDAVRGKIGKGRAESLFLNKLDDIMWLFNIRGCDIENNPVAVSFAYITEDSATLFIQSKALGDDVKNYLDSHGITVREYDEVLSFLGNLPKGEKVMVDKRYCSYSFWKVISQNCDPVEANNPTELLKAVKNPTELKNMKEVYLEDSAAVTKFIYWVKTHIGKEEITELSAADYLEKLRRQIPGFLDLSFPTIAAYNGNGAMMHYEATPESYAVLKPEGLLLIDSGGQYMRGTTDGTRTIVLGPISDEIKFYYTKVAAGMLEMTHARWLYGCTGRNLDILAREPLWAVDQDYKCGTGHGVGYILNVHEGPQRLAWQPVEHGEAVLEEGMDISNEPGVYVEGEYGIRIENMMVVCKGARNENGQFMYFDTLSYVPIDLDAIDPKYLTEAERHYLNDYHRQVREKISPFLTEEEREWLKEATREI